MSKELLVTSKIMINAPVEKIWDALVNPEQTKKYMFGCETVSDWLVGGPLLWQGVFDGQAVVAVKGTIAAIDTGKYLAYTVFDPNNKNMEDIPENYLTVTYRLENADAEKTLLTVTQGDFNKVAEGEKRYLETYNNGEGWNPILVQIKKLVEAQLQ
jgi:uncharacterized protein YndB with AHSA1/START domain